MRRPFLAANIVRSALIGGALLAALASAPVAAQGKPDVVTEGGVAYNRKTVINFEDDTIEGDLKTPDAVYLEARKRMRHKSLIRIRTDFRREVLGSISEL